MLVEQAKQFILMINDILRNKYKTVFIKKYNDQIDEQKICHDMKIDCLTIEKF